MSIADTTYDALIAAHEGLAPADSAALNRALILLLLDALDDDARAAELIETARAHRAAPPPAG